MQKNKLVLILLVFFSTSILAQDEQSISAYLKSIEAGQKNEVLAQLPKLKSDFPKDPSIKFLDAVLTEDGEKAAAIYDEIIQNYPKSRYADASVFRLYSFYYTTGHFNIAKKYADMLKSAYPSSPYVKLVNNQLPTVNNEIVDVTEVKIPKNETVKTNTEIKTTDKKTTEKPVEKKIEKKIEKNVLNDNYQFVIQAGAFSRKENALGLKQTLEASKYFVELKEKVIGGTPFHVIYVGRYVNKAEAEKVLINLKNEFEISGRIISKDKK